MRRIYAHVVRVAEAYDITINIEPHGYYTTKPEYMAEMLAFVGFRPNLRMNMDTGNTFIAGQDPVAFLSRFREQVEPCAYQGREPEPGGGISRGVDGDCGEPVRDRGWGECGEHPDVRRDADQGSGYLRGAEFGVRGPGWADDRAELGVGARGGGVNFAN